MPLPLPIPKESAEFTLEVTGVIDIGRYEIQSFHVERLINKIPVAIITVLDGSVADQTYPATDGPDFVPGMEVSLSAGTSEQKNEIFKGIITTQKITQDSQGTLLVLTVKDVAVRMTVGRKNAYYEQTSDDDVLKEILAKYSGKGITGTVDAAKFPTENLDMVQFYSTDWDFMMSRVEASARVAIVENGKITITTPTVASSDSNFCVAFGPTTFSFEAEMDARNEYSDVMAKSWNGVKRELEQLEVKDVDNFETEGNIQPDTLAEDVIGLEEYILQHGGKLSTKELEQWAYAKMLRSRLSKIRGRAKVDGTALVKPGDNITITQFSERYNGPAYVSGVRHEMTGSSTWYTDIQFGYNEEWFYEKYDDIVDQSAAGLVPGVNGLMIGIVTAISEQKDPDKNYRVKVKMPLLNKGNGGGDENEKENDKGTWARVATLDAGTDHGVFFRPEVGDEVVLGFLDNDPREPIVLGALFSQKNAVPEVSIEDDEKNFQKGIFTKNGLEILFDDDKETILIATKKRKTDTTPEEVENSVLIDAKMKSITLSDKNKNEIKMDENGITITSSGDLTLTTKDETGIPKGDIKIEGLNVELSAQSQFTAEGTAGAKLSSSGATTVEGAVVQVN